MITLEEELAIGRRLKLPLKECSCERLTFYYDANEWRDDRWQAEEVWRAPKGKRFKITGEFTIWSNQSEFGFIDRPLESRAIMERNFKGSPGYESHMEEAKGNFREAFREWLDWDDDLPSGYRPRTCFSGPYLEILADSVRVKGPIEAEYYQGYLAKVDKIAPGIEILSECFHIPGGEVEWKQWYAEGKVGHCRIRLVNYQEPEPELSVVITEEDNKLAVPVVNYDKLLVVRSGPRFPATLDNTTDQEDQQLERMLGYVRKRLENLRWQRILLAGPDGKEISRL